MLKESSSVIKELHRWLSNQNDQYSKMNQSMLTFLNFYKEIEQIANQPIPRDCHKAQFTSYRQSIQKALGHHNLCKMKLEIPDLDHINQENSLLLQKSTLYLSSLQIFIDTNTVFELETTQYSDLKAKLDQLT